MILPIELCKGMTKSIYNAVEEIRSTGVKELRGDHPISRHEVDAENAGLRYLTRESKKQPSLKMGLLYEQKTKGYLISDGNVREIEIEELKELPDIAFLSDPIDGSKAEIAIYLSSCNKPMQIGETQDAFSTVIAFNPDRHTLKDAAACALQRWDGWQFQADENGSTASYNGEEAVITANRLDKIASKDTKFYTAAHYGHALPMSTLVVEEILRELKISENDSPGVRSTGCTTADILKPTMTRSIAFDLREPVDREMRKYGLKMKRGCHSWDVAPPGLLAKRAGAVLKDVYGNDIDCDLLADDYSSYFAAPPGEAGEKVLKIIRDKVLPKIPEKVKSWKEFWDTEVK